MALIDGCNFQANKFSVSSGNIYKITNATIRKGMTSIATQRVADRIWSFLIIEAVWRLPSDLPNCSTGSKIDDSLA
jgi:hypothetical protein